MEYLKPKFTLPAGPRNVSQEEWDRIFGPSDADISKAVATGDIQEAILSLRDSCLMPVGTIKS